MSRAAVPNASRRPRTAAWDASPRARLVLACLVGLAGLACATPSPSARLPEEPFVFVHRTLAQGRDRAEALQKRRGEGTESGQGVLKLNEVGDMVDRVRGVREAMTPDLQGRLALYHPREERIEPIEAFLPGSVPCDWSPDRTRILVASRQHGAPRLLQYSLERRDVGTAVLPTDRSVQISGSYGPAGRVVYADAQRAGDRLRISLWATRPGGADERLTPGPDDLDPRWSPDGRVVLFEGRLRNGAPVIEALDVTDELAEPRVIARGREARFSPLGDWVVYSRERGGGWRLWRMRPDGTGKTALGHATQGDADERYPSVSPDGQWVVYVAEEDDRQRIRIRGMDGSGDRLLVEDADGTLPVW